MYQVIKAALTPTNASKLTQLLQVKTKLTVNEAEIVILIGFAIKYSQDYEDVKKFLKFLPFMNDIEITGLPAENASVVLTGFILQYYKTIYMLLENLEKAHSYIAQCISSHIFQKKEAVLLNFIQNSKKNEMFGIEIEAWALSPFISLNLANSLMQTIYYRYLRGRKINIQFTTLHTKIIALILAIIRNQPEIITAESSVISEVFKITFKFANKFLDKKISSKKLFVICVEFQLYCVTFQDILELSLTNFNLRSVYGKYPLIKCWLYYSVHLITMQNESILLEVLNLYQMYLPKIFEDYNEKIVAGYIEILMICQVYVREYTETLLGLVVETIRSKPDCLDVYKKNLGSLPGFIRDTATWECVFLSKEVFPMPALTPNCFNNVQSPEEALCVFVIVSNKITQFSCEELKTLLQELSKINFAFELLEFLCDRFVDFIKRLEKIGVFNRHKKSEQKLTILIKAMGAKTNCVQPSQLFNVFWTYLFHLHVQTGFDIMEVTNDLSRIAEKTLWSDCVVFGNISPQYFYKVNQKLKGLYESGSYDELLGVYINCEILKMQHQSENFINYCLNSKLPHKIQDVLLGEYFLSMKRKKYSPGRVKNDLTCLIKFIAANKRRKFIESIVDIDSFSSLESCYCYEFLQILADFDFFRFSFNLLGCASLKKTNVFLRHTGEILVIERPSEFYKFFLGFVTKSFGYAINIARKEVSFCCAMFLSESVNNEEDRASKEFIRIFLQYFTKAKVSEKLYDDLHLFHKWFVGKYKDVGCLMQGKSFCDQKDKKIADKEEKNNLGGNEKTLGEVEKEINLLSEVLNSPADPIKVQVKFLLFRKNTEEEFNKGINKLILDIFDSLEKLQDGLLYLTWIVSKFPDYNLEIFKEFEINILEYLSKNKAPIILNSSKKIGLVNSMPNLQKEPYITESSILLIVKFLKQQFHQSTLNQKNCNVAIGKIFEKIIMKHRNFTGPSLLKLCIACLKLSKSKYNLPNTYQLHSLSIQALFTLQIPDFNIQQVLSSSYITLLKLIISIVPTSPKEIISYTVKYLPGLALWQSHFHEYFPMKNYYDLTEPLMHVLSANLHLTAIIPQPLPEITQNIIDKLKDYPEIQKFLCIVYSRSLSQIKENVENYEESQYLFSNNPGYYKLLEYLSSPIISAKSFAIKHFSRAPIKTKIFYMDKLLFIAQPSQNYSNYFKFKLENDIWELLSKIAISSPICLTQLLQKLKFSFTFAKNFENYLGSQWIEFIQKTAKKNKFFWEEHVEIMNFVNNLWLIVQEDGIRNGLVKIFNDGKCVYHNLRMSVLQDFEIKRVGLNVGFLKKRPILTVFDKKEKAKSVIFAIKKNLTQASSYNYIFKLLLSYMKEKQLPIRVKLRKFECMSIRNKGEIGSILEYTEVYPYEYKDIIISHAGYSLLLFFLGLQDTSPLLFVSETQKVILDSTKLKIAGKHHKYFKVHRDCDLEKFKFYIISGFLACREIFENLLWTMQESFWAQHKLHFYLSMPITSIISKLNSRIGKSNN